MGFHSWSLCFVPCVLALLFHESDDGTVHNWYGDITYRPEMEVTVTSRDDIVEVLTNPDIYPSPVRPAGSRHSMVPVEFHTDGEGTLLDMRRYNKILEINETHVTAQAGALYIDVAEELQKHNLQFHMNPEIGTMTVAAAAVAATKDSSLPGQFGQVTSYVAGIKMITVDGTFLDIRDEDSLYYVRSSHGLFGVVYEVTFRVKPLQALAVEHVSMTSAELQTELPKLLQQEKSIKMLLFPYDDGVLVELLRSNSNDVKISNTFVWGLRNRLWQYTLPRMAAAVVAVEAFRGFLYFFLDQSFRVFRLAAPLMKAPDTNPTDQQIRYFDNPGLTRYSFSYHAFSLENLGAQIISEYFDFCLRYYEETGFRLNLPTTSYISIQDNNAILSYASKGAVISIDPVSTGYPGWREFLRAFNEFAEQFDCVPMLGQTQELTATQVEVAFGEETIAELEAKRREYDPEDRLLNAYFRNLLPVQQ